jgi:hypothetical protein
MLSLAANICAPSSWSSLEDFYVHLDNTPPQNSRHSTGYLRATKARSMPQPASNSDLAPSDFLLFGSLDQEPQGIHFPDGESLKSAICQIFSEIDRDMSDSAFLDWIERLEWVIESDGKNGNTQIKAMKKPIRRSEK